MKNINLAKQSLLINLKLLNIYIYFRIDTYHEKLN